MHAEEGKLVDLDQEGRRDDHVAARCGQLAEVRGRAPWVDHMLEHLLADHDVEPAATGDRRAQVEVGVVQTRVLLPWPPGVGIAADLGRAAAAGSSDSMCAEIASFITTRCH